jgi:hypothetical protein
MDPQEHLRNKWCQKDLPSYHAISKIRAGYEKLGDFLVVDFLFFLHLVGLMIAAAGGLGSGILMRKALAMPADQAKVVRGLGPLLAKVALTGLALLWITGPIMVFSIFGGFTGLPSTFWIKIAFALLLTAFVVTTHLTYGQIAKGNMAVASRLPKLGPAGGVAALLTVLFAVITFNTYG